MYMCCSFKPLPIESSVFQLLKIFIVNISLVTFERFHLERKTVTRLIIYFKKEKQKEKILLG